MSFCVEVFENKNTQPKTMLLWPRFFLWHHRRLLPPIRRYNSSSTLSGAPKNEGKKKQKTRRKRSKEKKLTSSLLDPGGAVPGEGFKAPFVPPWNGHASPQARYLWRVWWHLSFKCVFNNYAFDNPSLLITMLLTIHLMSISHTGNI